MRRILWVELMVILVLFGCKGSIPQGTARQAEEDQIREVVFRYQFTYHARWAPVYYISFASEIATRTDPSDEFMRRFSSNQSPVKKASQAEEYIKGASDASTKEEGPILTVGEIKWLDRNTVEAEGSYHGGPLDAEGGVYTVKRKSDKWIVQDYRREWVS